MIEKIQVLLIDDNPTFAFTKVDHTTLHGIKAYQLESHIPFIEPLEQNFHYFELRWLRNQEDLQIYKKLCREIEDHFSAIDLGRIEGAIPEIVLFDYALTGHEDKSFFDDTLDNNLLEQVIPNIKLKQFWQKESKDDNIVAPEHIEMNVYQISDGLNSDNLGCIGGILTVTQFRNHPCIGIATSRKTDAHIKGQDIQFMESLVREPNQFEFSLRGNIANLNWKKLLSTSVELLKKRLETLVKSNKIILNLPQLMDYIEELPTKQEERIFTFESVYGERHLPLDGLFIDVDIEQRDHAIIEWISGKNDKEIGLVGILTNTTNINIPEIMKAKLKYNKIVTTQVIFK